MAWVGGKNNNMIMHDNPRPLLPYERIIWQWNIGWMTPILQLPDATDFSLHAMLITYYHITLGTVVQRALRNRSAYLHRHTGIRNTGFMAMLELAQAIAATHPSVEAPPPRRNKGNV